MSIRSAVLLAAFFAAGCPATQMLPAGGDGGGGDAGAPDGASPGDGGSCDVAALCPLTFRYPADGAATVELRGDFAADGWTTGIAMTLDEGGDEFTTTLGVPDDSTVVYKFVVDGDQWVVDPGNPETTPDGFGGVNSVVRADCRDCPVGAAIDWRDAVLYFVMIDRFANGDESNDAPLDGLEWPANYQGGDLAGLLARIEAGYFDELGVNTLWLSSPIDNADGAGDGSDGHAYSGYHGYWPADLTAIESRIGDEDELRAVIDAAHARGIKILIDYVMNHVHAESPAYQQHPDWFWPNDNGVGGNCICGGGCNWDDPFDRKRCWFTSYLPDFDFRNTDARNYSVQNAIDWAKDFGVDGFRLDAVKHIEDSWLLALRARLDAEVEYEQVFYLVGETYTGDRDLIKYYVNPDTMLDGQFDFPLRAEMLRVLLRRQGSMQDLVGFLDSNASYYGPGAVMSTFIGNHDVPRSIHLAEDTPLFGDWDDGKFRAWNDPPTLPAYARPFERVAVAYALLFTTPGVPLIYYGDEIGLPGAGDPDNRRAMQWTGWSAEQTWLRDRIARLIEIRAAHPSLRRGTRSSLGSTSDVYAYEMQSAGDSLIIALNRGDGAAEAPGVPSGSYTELLTGATVSTPVTIPARGAVILASP